MSDYAYLEPGFIPAACISSPGELDQMVAGAQPVSTISFNYVSATAPDIITYPDLARATWQDTSAVPHLNKLYNPTTLSWEVQVPSAGSITGSMIADDTIPLSKLQHTAGQAGFVIRENSTSTAYIADDPQNLFTTTDRLSVTVLSLSAAGSYVLTSNGVANTWGTFSSLLTAGSVPLTAISNTGATNPSVLSWDGATLAYRTVVSATANATLPVGKLVPDTANYIAVTDPTGTFVTWISPAQLLALLAPSIGVPTAVTMAIPAPASSITPIVLASDIKTMRWVVVCDTTNAGYVQYDEVPIESVMYVDGAGIGFPAFTPCFNTSTNTISLVVNLQVSDPGAQYIPSKTNGTILTAFTSANWSLKVYYTV